MPPVVAALVAMGLTAVGAYVVIATVVLSAGMAVYGSAQARRAERQARDSMLAAMKDRMITRVATEAPHRFIYGRAKVGADIVAIFTSGDKDQFKHLVCVHAAHECDAIEEVYVNNALVDNLDASGDPTAGRFAVNPNSEIVEENKTGPSFTLSYSPRNGTLWVFSGTGPDMQRVAVTNINGKNITIAQSGPVLVSYERATYSKMSDFIAQAFEPATGKNPVVRVQKHLGGANDPVDAYLNSLMGSQWPATAVLRGLCYTVITLDLNHAEFQGGIPPIHAVIRGRKLYDPRTGLTAWSQNNALAIRDYLTSKLCGVSAADLPTAQFIAAANVCDEESNVAGQKRYTLNGTVTSDQDPKKVLEAMAQSMAGGLVSTTWDIFAGKYIAPVAVLSQDDIVGGLQVTPGASDAVIFNGVKGQYISVENKYVSTDFKPYQNAAYRASDARDLYTNIDLPFTDSLQRVTNLARIFTEDQRNGFTIQAEFSLKAWPRKVGERITFNSPFLGQNGKVYRITDKSYSPNSAVQLTLKEDAASIWDYADATVVDSTPNSDLPDPWKLDPLASITCTAGESTLLRQADGSTIPRILVTFPQPAQTIGMQVEIEWRAVSSSTWNRTTVSAEETQAYLSPVTPGFFYVVRACVYNPYLNIRSYQTMTAYQVEVFKATPTVYKWANGKPATPSGAATLTWGNGTFGAAPSGWSLTIPTPPAGGDVTLWAATVLVTDISDTTTAFQWASADVANIGYSPNAAGTGPAGYSNARVFAYQRKATAPTGTPGAVDYDFTTGTITTATLANGWLKTIPASDGNPLYVTSASASASGTTDTIASGEWAGAVVLAYDGGAGTPGMNSASVTLYQRNSTGTAPALPSASVTYTFSPPGVTGLTNGWTTTIPAASAGKYLFATTATAAATTSTDAIATGEWAAAQILAQDGTNGIDGLKTAVVYAYQRAASAPAGTPGAVTYDFTSSAITTASLLNGWQKSIPAANGQPLYVTAATASGTGATDSIATGEWSGAVILTDAGNNGAPGLNNATVTLYQRSASATAPAKPTATMTYTFATGALTGVDNGWTTYIPSTGGAYLHTTFATAIGSGATDTIAPGELAAVQLMYDAADLIAAKAAADAANAKADAAAADGILDRGEKVDLISEMATFAARYTKLVADATALGVSSAAYTYARDARDAYLVSLDDTGSPPWDDITRDTPINRAIWRVKRTDYSREEIALQGAIAAKAATAPNLNVGVGAGNKIVNSGPVRDSFGPFTRGYNDTGTVPSFNPSFDPYRPVGSGGVYIAFDGVNPPSGRVCDIYDLKRAVVAGRRYEFSIYLAGFRCNTQIYCVWYKADGSTSTITPFAMGNIDAGTGAAGETLSNWLRPALFATAPADASTVMLVARMITTGGASPYLFTSMWYIGAALPAQTVPSEWSDGAPGSVREIGYDGDLNATKNTVTSGATAPASPANGDIWVDTNAPVTIKTRIAGAWVVGGNVPTALSHVDATASTKLGGIAIGATANTVATGALAARPTGANGDFYYATDTSTLYQKVGGAWVASGTVGAPAGTNVGNTPAVTVETGAANGTDALSKLTNPFSVAMSSLAHKTGAANGAWVHYGRMTPVVAGGNGALSRKWDLAVTGGEMKLTTAGDDSYADVYGRATNDIASGRVTHTAVDSTGLSKFATASASGTHGLPP